ncbi:hypothetical protein EB810_03710 [Altererythrobacter sp. FM1]|uniref:hypothetical protein n=1 Tax=Tsuneonella flava TaxID=2055955 RepID=UPI000C7FB2C6|nr:hypothetical protein [Tsuneonella flava]ROT97029.1 hypothetical protein EB810_03710 [Altererythrobacter sp. FM1]
MTQFSNNGGVCKMARLVATMLFAALFPSALALAQTEPGEDGGISVQVAPQHSDMVVRNAMLIDGSGAPLRGKVDIDVRGGIITEIRDSIPILSSTGLALPHTTIPVMPLSYNYEDERQRFRIREYVRQGGHVSVGLDSGGPFQLYGFQTVRELELLLEAGLTPLAGYKQSDPEWRAGFAAAPDGCAAARIRCRHGDPR